MPDKWGTHGPIRARPIDPDASDPYTRCRIITMNGIKVEAILFGHNLARTCVDPEVKRQLARTRYIEARQQNVVNRLLPGGSSVLETTIAYEQVAVDLTSWVALLHLRISYDLGAGYVREAHERQHQEMFGRDYRVETEGPHPDPSQRA
ncbi:hypothetical protein [Streptomyces sp. 147326]|uniref:hypothetical protein n=1 Tax=Streptomyces sp. 147326 TaxID=3074379 RepID=UPI00385733AB